MQHSRFHHPTALLLAEHGEELVGEIAGDELVVAAEVLDEAIRVTGALQRQRGEHEPRGPAFGAFAQVVESSIVEAQGGRAEQGDRLGSAESEVAGTDLTSAPAHAPNYMTFVLLGIPLGFASACFQSINTVAVQQATEPSMQGRVMALHQMALYGSTPIGALLMGWVIETSSPRAPFVLGSLAALACAAALVRATRGHSTEEADDLPVEVPATSSP